MPSFDLNQELSTFDALRESFGQYVVTPLNSFGLGGFVFDVEGDATHNLTAEITDHFTDANYAVQDHIAIRPKRITLKNYVGELVYRQNGEGNTIQQQVTRKLTNIAQFLPALSNAGTQLKTILDSEQSTLDFNETLSASVNIYGIFKNLNPPIPRQQQAYQFFKALMEQKLLVAVQTPFEYAANMAIETIVATQQEGTSWISDFSITLKEIRIARSRVSTFEFVRNLSPIADAQQTELIDAGKVQGKPAPFNSILSGLFQ